MLNWLTTRFISFISRFLMLLACLSIAVSAESSKAPKISTGEELSAPHATKEVPFWFEITTTTIQTIALAVAAVAACLGLTVYRKQLRYERNHEMATGLIRAAYALRDGINIIRNPSISISERFADGRLLSEQDRHQETIDQYNDRISEAGKRRSELEVKITEAQAVWGEDVRSWFMPLITRHSEVVVSVHTVMDITTPGKSIHPNNVDLLRDSKRVLYSESFRDLDDFDASVQVALDSVRI
jgi:hypothetical protein